MSKKKILLIDGDNTLYRAHYSHRGMSYKGFPTSCIYGFLSILRSVITRFNPDDVYICWDGKKHQKRMELHGGYKGHRVKLTDDKILINKQKTPLRNMIQALGVKQVFEENMEADDWIYILFRKLAVKEKQELVILSGDKDFHQLIRSNVTVWEDDTRKKRLLTKTNLKTHYNYTPKECASYLALVGDTSDDIEGVKGIGPVNARKILDNYKPKDLPKKLVDPDVLARYQRNMILIHLKTFYLKHLKGKIKLAYYGGIPEKVKKKTYLQYCEEYGLRLFAKASYVKTFEKLLSRWQN